MTKRTLKKGRPSVLYDDLVTEWRLDDEQTVPAIELCGVTVVRCPVAYYSHFNYGPELMALRQKRIVELGWSSKSLDMPAPPESVGEFCLLSKAIKKIKTVLDYPKIYTTVCWPGTVLFQKEGYGTKWDYCVLYFNHWAYEFYNLLFILGQKDGPPFENVPNPKIGTLPQILKWATGFETSRRKMYKENGFTWNTQKVIRPFTDVKTIRVN